MGVTILLLMGLGLAVTAQGQNCIKPVGGPNMSLKGNSIIEETFPTETKVTFSCDIGYTPAGGTGTITCRAGSWSTLTLKCEKKNCGSPGEMENGDIDFSEGIEFGAKIVITCHKGYKFVGRPGPREIFCGNEGWDNRLPVCEAVTCAPPEPAAGVTFRPDKDPYDYGDVITYSCQAGFTLNGTKSPSCSSNGEFDAKPPVCVKVQCKDAEISNYTWAGGSRPPYGFNAAVTLACEPGFKIKGERTVTCDINSRWSPALPKCELVTCKPPVMQKDGTFSPDKQTYNYKDVVQYSCRDGFNLIGSKSGSCSDDGTFKPGPPSCAMVTCKPPVMQKDGTFSPDKQTYNYNDVVQYSCRDGFKLIGSKSGSCSGDGTFKPGPPSCDRDSKGPHDDGVRTVPVWAIVVGVLCPVVLIGVGCYCFGFPAFIKKRFRRSRPDNDARKPDEEVPLS